MSALTVREERGYARVSTSEQSVDLQVRALVVAGVPSEGIVTEAGSGRASRPGLDRLLGELERGDRLTVWRLDRLFRSTRHMLGRGPRAIRRQRADPPLRIFPEQCHTLGYQAGLTVRSYGIAGGRSPGGARFGTCARRGAALSAM